LPTGPDLPGFWDVVRVEYSGIPRATGNRSESEAGQAMARHLHHAIEQMKKVLENDRTSGPTGDSQPNR